jgi:hypothetical protein
MAKRRNRTRKRKQRGGAKSSKLFTDAYTVTLRTVEPRRFEKMQQLCSAAGIPLQPWDGTFLKPEELEKLPALGVGTTNFKDRSGATFNLGVIGAFLGHRTLLEHIAKTGEGKVGTFISEDDIDILPDFYEKLNAVEGEIEKHAGDWDIIFLDKNLKTIAGQPVSPHLIKLDKDITATKNWGIWSYIVKNSSVASKILPTMVNMLDVPDIQLARYADVINMYLITPSITYGDAETSTVSLVTKIDSAKS